MWPFSTIKHLRVRNVELNTQNRTLKKQREAAKEDLQTARRIITERDGQVAELTAQVKDIVNSRNNTRAGIAAYVDVAKSGGSWFGRIVSVGDGPVKDRTLVLQPLAGRRKQLVNEAKGWARKILMTFDIDPKGLPCLVERRGSDGKINVTEEAL